MKRYLIIWLILLVGCTNPFSTRTPGHPQAGEQPQAVNSLQNYPDSLLAKLKLAFAEKNINYYMDCLADSTEINISYTFVPQQSEALRLANWTVQDEYNYFYLLTTHKDITDIILQVYNIRDWTLVGASQDTIQTRFSYEIEIDFQTEKEFYRGESIFKLARSQQSLWYVFYWEDLLLNSDQTDSTWSTLKANYR